MADSPCHGQRLSSLDLSGLPRAGFGAGTGGAPLGATTWAARRPRCYGAACRPLSGQHQND